MEKNFDADVAQLIKLVTHSVYSNKDVFLRELLSNANDAIQKAKMLAAQDTSYLGKEKSLEITVSVDEENNTITIEDTGVGMSREEIIENLGTIANSGTKKFMEKIQQAKKAKKSKKGSENSVNDLVGQFGIGFYSAFMVAEKVEVESKASDAEAVSWSSQGEGSYEVAAGKKETRGTVIRLFLHDDDEEYANPQRLRELIRKHSNYIPVPIKMLRTDDESMEDAKKTDEFETVNQMKSLWTKQKSEVDKKEYKEFYQMLTFDQHEPLDTIHLHIEGVINFKALLYIPQKPPMFGHIDPEQDYGPSLYVQNVMIQERCKDLLPVRLRFVRGVVETPDLSLNVSREMIQSSALLAKIQKTLIKEVLKSLVWLKDNESDAYQEFYKHYNRYIKEGVHYDADNKDKIADVLLYHSRKNDKTITLKDYVDGLSENDPIYYLIGTNLTQLQASPYLEQFKDSKTDVLLMDDAIDERVMKALGSYKEHELQSVMQADVTADKKDDKEQEKKEKEHKDFLTFFQETVGNDRLNAVKVSTRLTDSPAILVGNDGENSAQMERIMNAMGQKAPKSKRTLEINLDHPLMQKTLNLFEQQSSSKKKKKESKSSDSGSKSPNSGLKGSDSGSTAKDLVLFAYEQAVLLEGGMVENMHEFIQRASDLISKE